ncbi:MAG TPA: polysaccharide deacetylase family protein [Bacteroidia bacterium]
MLLIYSHNVTNRLKYTFDLIFKSVLGIEYDCTTDEDQLRKFQGAKISYGENKIADELFYPSSELLFSTGIHPIADWNLSVQPADIFSASFFLATRYEEYLPFTTDQYGRFSARQCLAYQNGLLQKPLINIWAKEIQNKISERYPSFSLPQKKYSHLPTIDIDNAYAFLGKGFLRTAGGYLKAAIKFDRNDLQKRKNVLSGKEKDPFDTYDLQFSIHKRYNLKPVYFFLLGDWAEHDKNLSYADPLMQALIKKIAQHAETGIHPSYASNRNPEKIKIEKERLGSLSGRSIHKSRQHFLKLRFPHTYRNLIAAGITDDYSMGFADEPGFRAGICTPYKFYDLEKEEETDLTIHPFAIMDGTFNNYLKITPEQAIEKVKLISNEIKNVNGQFVSVWHNEILGDWREWKGWGGFYEKVIQIVQ